jgi:dihydrofolate reductase
VELTEVDLEVEGDAHMPPLSPAWREVARENHPARDGRPAFAFVTLLRDR